MSTNIGFQLPVGVQPLNPVPVDTWSGPYSGGSITDALNTALSAIPSSIRFNTMEVRIFDTGTTTGHKYWFQNGIADENLVEFASGGSNGKHWLNNQTIILNSDDTMVISGNLVLSGTNMTLNTNDNQVTVSNIVFSEYAQIYIGGYLLLVDSNILNNGLISAAGGVIFSGNSTITGNGVIN